MSQKTKRRVYLYGLVAVCLVLLAIIAVGHTLDRPLACNYADGMYVGNSTEQCSTLRFLCAQGMEYFSDGCGCGCRPSTNVSLTSHVCMPEDRKEVCIEVYNPVCGWFEPSQVQCITYPCAQTFGNSCFACGDKKVAYYTEGECPTVPFESNGS